MLEAAAADWSEGNFASGLSLYATDVTHTAFTDGPIVCRDRDAMVEWMREFLREWERYWIQVEEIRAMDDQRVMLSGRQYGVGKRSGLEIEAPLTVIWRLDEGRVVESHWHPDHKGALEAAGLSE